MDAIQTFAATAGADLSAAAADLTTLQTNIAALDMEILNFQNTAGTLSADDQTALNTIATASAALRSQADALVPASLPPVPPGASVATPAVAPAAKS